jgi:MYXO-CTERM domain-containing protein
MQKPSFRTGVSLLAAAASLAALVAAPSQARAGDPPKPCDPDTYRCFTAEKIVLGKNLAELPLENGLNSGWIPSCSGGNPSDPCSSLPSGNCPAIAACIQAAMNDSKVDLSMLGDWDVAWPEIGKLQINPRKKPNGGKYSIKYKLSPTFGILINAFNYKNVITIDPFDLLKAIGTPGATEFNYEATGSCSFDPWAFSPPASCPVSGMPTDIFALPLSTLTGDGIDQYVKIEIALVAGTETTFTWQTDEITVDGGDAPITATSPTTNIPYAGGSPAQVVAGGKGKLGYSGKTFLKPAITVLEIAGIKLGNGLKFPIDVGADIDFDGTLDIALKKTAFDVNLPDLYVPTTTLDFGTVEVGQKGTKAVKLENTGDLMATSEFISANAMVFQAQPPTSQIEPKATGMVNVVFTPKQEGPIEATFTVNTNDPDVPLVTFKVKGKGKITPGEMPPDEMPPETGGAAGMAGMAAAGTGGTGEAGKAAVAGSGGSAGKKALTDNTAPEGTSSDAGGCGCRTAGDERGGAPAAALGLLAGLAVLARRRRSLPEGNRRRASGPARSPGRGSPRRAALAGGVAQAAAARGERASPRARAGAAPGG